MFLITTITSTQAAVAADPTQASDPMSITYNGHQYKTLANHNPHSAQVINEYDKLYNLNSSWHLCPRTPDALHVCATHRWQSYALVFVDGSAHFTQCAPSDPSYKPGMTARGSDCLVQKEGKYASLVGGVFLDPQRCRCNQSDDDYEALGYACGSCGGCDRSCICLVCGAEGYSSRDCYKDHGEPHYCSDVLIRRKLQ